MKKPLVLCIMDGVGINTSREHNSVKLANMPFFNELLQKYPHSKLRADGEFVGLPAKLMGNSEVGHITIGSGRVVPQYLLRFQKEKWNNNKPLNDFIADVRYTHGIVHFAGLMSSGCVHANIDDEIIIMKYILDAGLKVCIHFVADGRDVPPKSAQGFIDLIKSKLSKYLDDGRAFFGTLSGRYYTMDRNHNLDRTELAFNAIANAQAEFSAPNIDAALRDAYARGETDEFIKPIVIKPTPISKNDGFIWGNYRSDRSRQIVRAVLDTGARILCFSQYGEGLNEMCPALLDDEIQANSFGQVLAASGKTQLRIAETEKYNHVTYFFDIESNDDLVGEKKILIPSPDVATFDLKPEMSAGEITDKLLGELPNFDVVILNYANGDMVGHTGVEPAAIRAMEYLDTQLARLVPQVLNLGGAILITADHGNCEEMWDYKNNAPCTSHTTNPVNFIVVGLGDVVVHDGGLADIAPTMLKILDLPKPNDMTGHSLI
ncbi:MAG: 2,3-bisphosphoglycerate-independent phosphoglycerate mutase [Alphaproteobacteria bacterium]|nr:2,3-bisphosphoglycerate-independent phosphoglycerate mutase [Alphaproteobacteria bacterium]